MYHLDINKEIKLNVDLFHADLNLYRSWFYKSLSWLFDLNNIKLLIWSNIKFYTEIQDFKNISIFFLKWEILMDFTTLFWNANSKWLSYVELKLLIRKSSAAHLLPKRSHEM